MYNDLPQDYDYRMSHRDPDKGMSYDDGFRTIRWRRYVWRREQRFLDYIVGKYPVNKPIRHLDFACGTGRIMKYLAGRTETSTGVDVSESMLEVTRKTVHSADIIKADITRDDVLGDSKFNLITAFRFFPNAQPALRSQAINCLSKHLAGDGFLVFNNHQNHTSIRYQIARLRGRQWRTMSNREVNELVSSAGLTIAEVFPIGVLPAVDGHMLVPSSVHLLFDAATRACGLGQFLAQNVIFVCRPQTVK